MMKSWTLGGEIDRFDCGLLTLDLVKTNMAEDAITHYVEHVQPGYRSWCDTFEAPDLEAAIEAAFDTYDSFEKIAWNGTVYHRPEMVIAELIGYSEITK